MANVNSQLKTIADILENMQPTLQRIPLEHLLMIKGISYADWDSLSATERIELCGAEVRLVSVPACLEASLSDDNADNAI